MGLLPVWLLVLVVARDLVIVSGAVAYNFRIERLEADPTLISKLNTVLQIALAAVGVAALGFTGIPGWVVETLIWAVMVTILLSGTGYVREWSRRARVLGSHAGD